MSGFLYIVILWILFPFAIWRIYKRQSFFATRNLYFPWKEYFGQSDQKLQTGGIWIHALSLGESRSVIALIESLLDSETTDSLELRGGDGEEIPSKQNPVIITVTSTTISGYEQMRNHFGNRIQHHLMPLDYPFAVKAFLQRLKPQKFIVIETEIWPNTLRLCKERGIQLIYANARIKESSFIKYKRYASALMRQSLERFDAIFPQSLMDKQRLIELGAREEQIVHCGNLKFDLTVPGELKDAAKNWKENYAKNRFVWVAASVHTNEASQIIHTHKALMEEAPDALLLIAPRQEETINEILIAAEGNKVEQKSLGDSQLNGIESNTNILIIDTFGEMLFWNIIGDCVFIGGSLVPFGGHNLIEAAIMEKPVISGPHYHNLENLFNPAIEAEAVMIVNDNNALSEKLKALKNDHKQRDRAGKNAYRFANCNQGNMKHLLNYVLSTK